MIKKTKYLIIALILFLGCKSDEHPVPNYRFTAYIDLMLPNYNKDVFIVDYDRYGNRVGVGGVIVYRELSGEYFAFERYCPYDEKISCRVEIAEGNTTAVCPCCGSEFLIISQDGDVLEGPSVYSLKTYHTRIENGELVIYN